LGTWFIPIENSKNKVAITIFLSQFSINQFKSLLLLRQGTEWCYTNRTLDSHVSEKTITKQVTDRQLPEGRTPLKNRSKDSKALCLSGGKWVPHDLRRSAATLMTALGVLPNIADKCLNHKDQNRMQRTYQHHNYDIEKKVAWKLLGDRLELLTQSQVSNLSILTFGVAA
jgi:integrase